MKRNNKKQETLHNYSRQLPCFTWVSTGDCRYHKKCTYTHPSNIQQTNPDENSITILPNQKKLKHKNVDDTFFWPKMENSLNNIQKKYKLPIPNKTNKHDLYLFSIWNHYTLTMQILNNEKDKNTQFSKYFLPFIQHTTFNSKCLENKYTQSNRLGVFVQLSQSKSICRNNYN